MFDAATRGRITLVGIAVVLTSVFAGTTTAQQAPPPPAAPPAAATGGAELTEEAILARQQQAKVAQDLDEATRAQVDDLYKKALEQLAEADRWAAEATRLEQVMQEAPARLEKVKAELAVELPPPTAEVPEGASLNELEQKLTLIQADLADRQKQASEKDQELARRTQRRKDVPGELGEANKQLEELQNQLAVPPPTDEPPALTEAKRVLRQAQLKALEQRIRALSVEIPSYDATREALLAERDLHTRQVPRGEKLVKAWQDIVNERRRQEAERGAEEAEEARRAAASAHPAVRSLAEENARLAAERTELAKKIEQISEELTRTNAQRDEVKSQAQSVEDKVKAAGGVTEAVSVLLRKQQASLPDVRQHRRRIRARRSEISKVHLQSLELQDESKALTDLEQQAAQVLETVEPAVSAVDRQDIEAAVGSLLKAKRDYVDSLLKDLDTYLTRLVELDGAERQVIAETGQFAAYIGEHILWLRSTASLAPTDIPHAWQALLWLGSPEGWSAVWRSVGQDIRTHPLLYGVVLAAFVGWLLGQRRLRAAVRSRAELVRSARSDAFGHTVAVLAATLVLAVGWPAVVGFLAWRLWSAAEASDFVRAVAVGLRAAAILFFTMEILRQACRERGLGEVHFQWRQVGLKTVRKNLIWFMAVLLPASFIFPVIEWQQENEAWQDSLGRVALMVGLVSLGLFSLRVLRPSGQLLKDLLSRNRGGWLDRLRYVWYPLAFGTPLALALAAAVGYQYTAAQLSRRLLGTLWLVLGVILADALMLRWLFVARRRLALEKAEKRLSAEAKQVEAGLEVTGERGERVEEPEVDIFSISTQTGQLVRSVVVVALVIGLWLIWADVLPALALLDRVELWQVGEGEYCTLASLALAILILLVTVVAGKNLPGLLEIALLQRLPLDHGVRYAISAVTRYLISIIGVIVALAVIGIGWSKVQWLVAAMTVGLGFGLQEIFANFISGLIILLERPMRVGDTVTVGSITGTVTRIQIRATTIRDWDRKELVVPNKEFVTGQLINWTLSDTILRLVVPVGIAYGSDTRLAHDLLLKVARDNPHVLDDSPPAALFMGFGESSLDFQLRVFIPSMEYYLQVWHELHMAIDNAFREAGITIAFPQRDLHVRSFQPVMPARENRQETGPSTPPPSSDPGKGENA